MLQYNLTPSNTINGNNFYQGYIYDAKLTEEEAVNAYLQGVEKERRKRSAQKIISKHYLNNESTEIDNVEFAYAEMISWCKIWKVGEKSVEVGEASAYGVGTITFYKTEDVTESRSGLSKAFPVRNLARDVEGYNFSGQARLINDRDKIALKDIRFFIQDIPDRMRTAYYPVYIITTHDKDGYYYSFIDGVNGDYEICGNNKPYERKKKRTYFFTTLFLLLIGVLTAYFFEKYALNYNLYESFYVMTQKMFEGVTFENMSIFAVVLGALDAIIVTIYALSSLIGFGVTIATFIIALYKVSYYFYTKSLTNNVGRYGRGCNLGMKGIFKLYILRIIYFAASFGASFGLMYLWVHLVGTYIV